MIVGERHANLIRWVLLALIVLAVLVPSPGLGEGQRYAVVIVADGVRTPTGKLRQAVLALRSSGAFKKLPGLLEQIVVQDFANSAAELNRLGFYSGEAPYLAICELKPGSNNRYTRTLCRIPAQDAQAAVHYLRLHIDGFGALDLAKRIPTPAGLPASFDSGDYVNAKDGSVLVTVPAGEFFIGSRADTRTGEAAEPAGRTVHLESFQISKYEVTNAQYARFVHFTARPDSPGSQWKIWARDCGPRAPVVGVTWEDAFAYCQWAGLRLPTEQEWERAARGTDARLYPWGNAWDARRVECLASNLGFPLPVGQRPGGRSPAGCLDMAGNAAEWTSTKTGQDYRVVRGGGWAGVGDAKKAPASVYEFRCDRSSLLGPLAAAKDLGFRCARTTGPASDSRGRKEK